MSEKTIGLDDAPVSDGEFMHLMQVAESDAERWLAMRKLVLRKFGETWALVAAAMSFAEADERRKCEVAIAKARDVAVIALLDLPISLAPLADADPSAQESRFHRIGQPAINAVAAEQAQQEASNS